MERDVCFDLSAHSSGEMRSKEATRTNIVIVFSFIICMYLNVGFVIDGRYINGMFAIALGCMAFLLSDRKNTLATVWTFCSAIAFACTLLNFDYDENYLSRALPALMFGFSVMSAVAIYMILSALPPERLHKPVVILSIIFFTGAILEVSGVLRDVSDSFRTVVFADAFVYDSEDRDLMYAGFIRPKFFSQEPSHLAKMLGCLAFGLYASRPNPMTMTIGVGLILIGYYATRSPTVLLSLALIFVLWANLQFTGKAARGAINIASALTMIGLCFFLADFMSLFPGERAAAIAEYRDTSAIERFGAPPLIAWEALHINPLTGIGFGTRGYYLEMIVSVYAQFPYYEFYRLQLGDVAFGWYSAFFEGIACLGIIGFTLVITGICRVFGGLAFASILPIIVAVSLIDSGFPAPRMWAYVAFYLVLFNAAVALTWRAQSWR